MKASMDKYIILTKIYLKEYRVHKVSVFFKLVELPLQLILYLFLWKFIARTSPVDYSYMVLYYLLTGLLSLSYPFLSIALDIQDDILEGGIANALVRPYIYVMPYFCKYIAWMCIYSVVYIPVVLYLLVFHNITLIQVLLFVVSSALGMLIEFLTWFAIGLLSFYFGRIRGAVRIIAAVKAIVSGSLIPLSLMPVSLQTLTKLFPFRFFTYIPVSNLLEAAKVSASLLSIASALLWIGALSALSCLLWYYEKRNLQASIS